MNRNVIRGAIIIATVVIAACSPGETEDKPATEARSGATECLLHSDERVQIANTITAAVDSDLTLKKVQSFLAEFAGALANRPPDGIGSAFHYESGGWVSDPTQPTEKKLLVFNEHWSLKGDAGEYVDDEIELVNNGLTILSSSSSNYNYDESKSSFSADGWSASSNVYGGMSCYAAGSSEVRTPGTSYKNHLCGFDGTDIVTFRVEAKNFLFKVKISQIALISSPRFNEPPQAEVEYQGNVRSVSASPKCPQFEKEIESLVPSYGALFGLPTLRNVLLFSP